MNKNEKMFFDFYGEHFIQMKAAEKVVLELATLAEGFTTAQGSKFVSRIKHPDSMKNKLQEDGLDMSYKSIFEIESDAIGVRVITESLSHVYAIYDNIKHMAKSEGCDIVNVKDYIKNPKDSGYRSLHIILEVETEDEDFPKMKAELQIRTAVMDCWASLEHIAKYKQKVDVTDEILDMLELYQEEALKELEKIK